MNISELKNYINISSIEHLEKDFLNEKENNKKEFVSHIEKLKVIFISSKNIEVLNKIAMIFKFFKIHSAVPLIVSKLRSSIYYDCGGTLVYSLSGLRINHFREELQDLWEKEISYEMEQMLLMNRIYERD